MRNQLLIISILFLPYIGNSQEIKAITDYKKNSIYIEAFGQGMLNSICFDRILDSERKIKNTISGGLSFWPGRGFIWSGTNISYNFLTGQENNHLEFGLGFSLTSEYYKTIVGGKCFDDNGNIISNDPTFIGTNFDCYTFLTPKIGYRFQRKNGGLQLRITFTPMVPLINRFYTSYNSYYSENPYYTYFKSYFYPYYKIPVFPWAGASIGYTF